MQNIETTPEQRLRAAIGACGECGAEGAVHDFHGDYICADCLAQEEAAMDRAAVRAGEAAPPL